MRSYARSIEERLQSGLHYSAELSENAELFGPAYKV